MTSRMIHAAEPGPVALDLAMNSGSIRITVDPGLKQALVLLKTDDSSGPAADAVRDATVTGTGRRFAVRVPDAGGSFVQRGGGVVVTGTLSNVAIVNGRVFSNGREILPTEQPGGTMVEAEVSLPAGSTVKLVTLEAHTVVTGTLTEMDYEASSGSLAIEEIGALDASITSGEISVGVVAEALDVTLTSGTVSVGQYKGSDARLHLTSGVAYMHASPESSGRLSVNMTSGSATITGAAHLSVKRRVVSGSLRIT